MHEASLVANLVERSLDVAEKEHAEPVAVGVRVGALTHIDEAYLREHFTLAVSGTPLDGARLDIEMDEDPAVPGAQDLTLLYVDVLDEGGD